MSAMVVSGISAWITATIFENTSAPALPTTVPPISRSRSVSVMSVIGPGSLGDPATGAEIAGGGADGDVLLA